MKSKHKKGKILSRRTMIPLLGGSFVLPMLGFSQSKEPLFDDDQYEVLLKPDGTTVKVKKEVVKQSKVVKSKVSNNALLKWLDKTDKP